jgi:hypothetical protein
MGVVTTGRRYIAEIDVEAVIPADDLCPLGNHGSG